MLILSFLQHNDVTLHGPFNTIEDLRIFAVAKFGEVAADLQIDQQVHHPVGNYWLKASIPFEPEIPC